MCGLLFSSSIPDPSEEFLKDVEDFIQHRGICKPKYLEFDGMLMAHSLLPVQGESPVFQPINSNNNILIFSGELWNHDGYDSDTQYLFDMLNNTNDIGLTINELQGMYAFVYYSNKLKCIFFASDIFGEIPLYFAWVGKQLIIASEIKQLIALGAKIKNIVPALPGELYTYDPSSKFLNSSIYHSWIFTNNVQELNVNSLRGLIKGSVREKYQSIDLQKSALLLSGGLDSAIMAYELAELGLKDTFTVAATDHALDLEAAESICNKFGLSFNPVIVDELEPSSAIAVTEVSNRSIIEEMCCHLILANHISRKNIQVVFSGCGADEIFVGYRHLLRYRNKQTRKHLQEEFVEKYHKMDLRAFNKAYMLNAIEVRNPYLSRSLMDFAATLEVDSLLIGKKRQMKLALRQAYKPILEELSLQPKLIARETMGAKQILREKFGESPFVYRPLYKEIFSDPTKIYNLVQNAKYLS